MEWLKTSRIYAQASQVVVAQVISLCRKGDLEVGRFEQRESLCHGGNGVRGDQDTLRVVSLTLKCGCPRVVICGQEGTAPEHFRTKAGLRIKGQLGKCNVLMLAVQCLPHPVAGSSQINQINRNRLGERLVKIKRY